MDPTPVIELARDAQEAVDQAEVAEAKAEEALVKNEEIANQWQITQEMHMSLVDRLAAIEEKLTAKEEAELAPELQAPETLEEQEEEKAQVAELAVVEELPPPVKKPRQPEARKVRLFG